MRHAWTSFAGLLTATLVACGGPPARTPEGGPATLPPAKRDGTAEPAPRVKRPDELAAWLHADDPDAIVELAGARPLLQLGTADEEIGRWLSVVDLTKPVDLVVTTTPPKKAKKKRAADAEEKEGTPKLGIDAIARFRVKDVAKAIDALRKDFDVTADGTRIRAVQKKKDKPKEVDAEDEAHTLKKDEADDEPLTVLCDFGGAKSGLAREALHVRGSIATIDKLFDKTAEEHEATRGIAKVVGRVTAVVLVAYLGPLSEYASPATLEKACGLSLKIVGLVPSCERGTRNVPASRRL
ncbi:MAG: hypothetical protein ACK6CU_09305 [Deltaproteobacteria bacterium]